jgi:hypothetical protein
VVEISTIEGRTLSTTETNWFCTAWAEPVAGGVVVVEADVDVVVPCDA